MFYVCTCLFYFVFMFCFCYSFSSWLYKASVAPFPLINIPSNLWFHQNFLSCSTHNFIDDDSDADLVTDYLDAPTLTNSTTIATAATAKLCTPTPTPNIKNYFISTVDIKDKGLMSSSDLGYANGTSGSGSNNHFSGGNNNLITITTPSGHTKNNNIFINNSHNSCNMVPIISVTPHSPGAKYNCILEDSLNHLQSIRETVVQMKNSSAQNTNFGNIGIINPTVIHSG